MPEMNLYQRISQVMQDIEYLSKDDNVGTGKSSYKAISEEKVTSAVRASLIKNGLVIFPIEQITTEDFKEYEKETTWNNQTTVEKKQRLMSTVNVKYKIVNIDNPEEFDIIASSGSGVDSQDKGVGKAMTYSFKYALLRTFAIPTGEDPDKIHNDDLEKETTVQKPEINKKEPSLLDQYKIRYDEIENPDGDLFRAILNEAEQKLNEFDFKILEKYSITRFKEINR